MTISNPPSPVVPQENATTIEAIAFTWAERHDRGPLTSDEQSEFEAWIKGDRRHFGAYARAAAATSYLDRVSALGPSFSPVAGNSARQDDTAPINAPRAFKRRTVLAAGGAVAASLAAGGLGLGYWRQRGHVKTPKGDIRRVVLAEGSAVTLNSDTEIAPRLTGNLRHIELMQGEALFDVMKDPSRPFIVNSGGIEVRAVGTSFTVRLHEDGAVSVAVREGIVDVRSPGEGVLRLNAGFYTRAQDHKPLRASALSPQALEHVASWRDGRIDLTGLTLREAASEFARYSDRKIIINDADIGDMKVTGIYLTSDPHGFARAAALSLDLASYESEEGVHIVAR